ncbi:MAG TPA: hypothetical protein VGO64_07445 [Candidatus Limnocylindrales bacterium]|nr:hypothetical protein [Candidatus Limnocylindrales bacterium]
MRPTRLVAGAALTAALALGSLPAIAASAGPLPTTVVDPATFQSLNSTAFATVGATAASPDSRFAGHGQIDASTIFTEPGAAPAIVVRGRPRVTLPGAHGGSAPKPPRYTLTGNATFYGNGTTAMRLPRGTTIVVCGGGGCLERIVTDYGPVASSKNRIIDLYTPDFFAVCGCPSWSGTTRVTVSVY